MKINLNVFLLILILTIVFWNFVLSGVRVASDLPFLSKELLDSSLEFPQTWSEKGAEGMGEYVAFFQWSWPINFVSGILSHLGISFSLLERLFLLIPILILGCLGIWKLSNIFKLSDIGKFIASSFYLLNTYIILLIDGGQLSVALAYAFFPICIYAIEKSINESFSKKVIVGLSIAILSFLDFRFVFILFLFAILRFFYQLIVTSNDRFWWVSQWFRIGFISTVILIGLHAFWLFPLLKAPIESTTFSFFTQTAFSPLGNIGHSILLLAPHWFKNVYGQISPLRFEFVVIPILVFLAPILRPKNKMVGFWILISAISIFLTKGVAEPLPNIYKWLFTNISGFSLFRDSSKFFVFLALSYSLLIGVTFDEIVKKFIKSGGIKFLLTLGFISYLLLLIHPIFLNQMTGMFSKPPLESEFSKLADILKEDKDYSRVFWIPYRAPLGYSSPDHPIEEASRLAQKRPFNIGTKGTYESFNFLREAPYMGQIFDISGIGYIVYPPLDPRRDDMHPDNVRYYQTFTKQLTDLNWLTKISKSTINLWKVNNHQDKFFVTTNIWWVIGSDNLYEESTKSAALKLSKNALIFAEENAGLGKRLDELPDAKIVLNNKTPIDLAASVIDPSKMIFPAKKLGFEPGKSGWWRRKAADLIRWRDFLQTKYGIDNLDFDLGGGWAVGEKNLKLKVQSEKLKKEKILLARVLESTRSGQLRFYQDNQLIRQIDTKKEGNNVKWFEVGQLVSNGNLTIHSEGDINVINALAVLDKNEWESVKRKANEFDRNAKVVNYDGKYTTNSSAKVTYKQVNSTKYIVTISNLTKPGFLIFSESYDPHWIMNGQKSFPVYSFLNGFRVEDNGKYLIEFEVQNWVYPGLVISGVTLLIILLIIFKNIGSKAS